MMKLAISSFAVAALLLGSASFTAPAHAAEGKSVSGKPLRGVVRPMPRRGGYSYKYLQGVNTRRFVDPTLSEQSPGGPFDSGFWFSTPNAPHGGDSPYMQ